MRIVLDAMGGDFAPERPVEAAVHALKLFPKIDKIILTGPEDVVLKELEKHGVKPYERLEIKHASEVISMSDKAVEGIRRKKDNSISRGVELVRDGLADAFISAGHTGAVVAASSIRLRTLPGIDRPGIATVMPTEKNLFVLMDAGANIDARPEHLAQYAIMGSIYSKHILHFENPKVGLLSIGTEDVKGNDLTKEAFKMLSDAPINFHGNVEGRDLFEGVVEVVVCDGFIGNIVLKTSESIAGAMFRWIKHELKSSPFRMLGAWLARNAFLAIKKKTNYEEYGGSLLLGVSGICVIAHGSSTVKAITNAIRVGVEAVDLKVNDTIVREATKGNVPHVDPTKVNEQSAAV
jgi:glycerol-3-phosphate acyltransferase PlsX